MLVHGYSVLGRALYERLGHQTDQLLAYKAEIDRYDRQNGPDSMDSLDMDAYTSYSSA
jgi:hypothetical protein